MAVKSKDRVDKYIYQNLLAMKDGERLPGVRAIMRDCGVSQLTVQSILKKYEDLKLVQASDRRGFFKVGDIKDRFNYEELDLVYCPHAKQEDPMMQFHGSLSHNIGKYCGKHWRSVRMHFMENKVDLADFKRIAGSSKCRACILVSPSSPRIGEIFRKNHVAYVNLFSNAPELDQYAPNLVIDNDHLVNSQLQHLISLGHKKIGYMHLKRPNEAIRDLQMRLKLFMELTEKYGIVVEPEWIQFGGYDSDTATKAMNRILGCHERPTALICNDHHLPGVYNSLYSRNLTPGKDFSVVGTDNMSISQILSPQATTIDTSAEWAARKALTMLERSMKDLDYNETINIECELIVRESTGKNP
jgi:DNA-binding LacI/PurR family transcriptional regulator